MEYPLKTEFKLTRYAYNIIPKPDENCEHEIHWLIRLCLRLLKSKFKYCPHCGKWYSLFVQLEYES